MIRPELHTLPEPAIDPADGFVPSNNGHAITPKRMEYSSLTEAENARHFAAAIRGLTHLLGD